MKVTHASAKNKEEAERISRQLERGAVYLPCSHFLGWYLLLLFPSGSSCSAPESATAVGSSGGGGGGVGGCSVFGSASFFIPMSPGPSRGVIGGGGACCTGSGGGPSDILQLADARAPRPSNVGRGGAAPQTTSQARGGHNAGPQEGCLPRFSEAARGTGTKSRDPTSTRRHCALRLGSLPTLVPLTGVRSALEESC
jgi:hypothetical protein